MGVNRFGHGLTVIGLIRISCGIPGFYPYRMSRRSRTGHYQASHLHERLPVLIILSWQVMRINIRTPLLKVRPSNSEHLPARGWEHECRPWSSSHRYGPGAPALFGCHSHSRASEWQRNV